MQIAVISDLHLGAGGPADAFGHDDSEFLRFLTFLEQNFERVVLLGDIWETLTGVLPGGAAAELALARRSHPEIAKRFSRAPYTFVHGNHDIVAADVEAAPEDLSIQADGVRLLFTHGHQEDPLVRSSRWVSEFGVWLGGWIRRLGLEGVHRWLTHLDSLRSGVSLDSARCPFQRWAIRAAKIRGADVMVTGHTHVATRAEHGSQLYLNSGTCAEGQISYLGIDTKRGNYGVYSKY